MNAITNTRNDNEESKEERVLDLASPFHNEIESFNSEGSYPDMELIVNGFQKPLVLHRKIVANASHWFKKNLNDKWGQRLEWPYDTENEVEREVLTKTLRYCYGETMNVGTKNGECFSLITTMTRLQLTCLDDVVTTMNNFIVEEAKRKIENGVELLKECTRHTVCCGTNELSLNKRLATVVLTKDNMDSHYREVVDGCLMMLPPDYLMMTEYGQPHTRLSEFCLRAKYVRLHSKEMSIESQHEMVMSCDWSTLNSEEFVELRLTGVADKDELLVAHEKALESCETVIEDQNERLKTMDDMEDRLKISERERDEAIEKTEKAERERETMEKSNKELKKDIEERLKENEELRNRLDETEREREEEKEKRMRAEREREELERRVEETKKEKEEKENEVETLRKQLTQKEEERDSNRKENEQLKKRLEIADKEREQHWTRVDELAMMTKGNCLFLISNKTIQ